jgi:hypothetical protein
LQFAEKQLDTCQRFKEGSLNESAPDLPIVEQKSLQLFLLKVSGLADHADG